MAVITSAQNGNFTDTATWVGGVVPGVSDDAVAAHVVTIDSNVTVISFRQSGTGKFLLGNGRTVTGNVTINVGTFVTGGTIECVATTSATINGNVSGPTDTTGVNVTGVVMNGTGSLTINGNVAGSPGNGVATNFGVPAVYISTTSTLTVNGNISSGGASKRGILGGPSANGTINIYGNVQGGSSTLSPAIYLLGDTATLNVVATNVSGGSTNAAIYLTGISTTLNVVAQLISGGFVASAYAIEITGHNALANITASTLIANSVNASQFAVQMSGASSMLNITANELFGGSSSTAVCVNVSGANARSYLTGRVIAGTGTNAHGINSPGTTSFVSLTGSAQANGINHGVFSSSTSHGVAFEGDMTDSQVGGVAVYARIFRMTATNSGVTRYATSDGSGSLVSRVSPDNATGVPNQSDVRGGTLYGYNNELSGTLTIPPVQAVKYGVPVGNTTGTGEFDLGRAVTVLGEAIALGMTTGSRQ